MRSCAFRVLLSVLLLTSASQAGFDDPPSELALVLVRKAKAAEKSGDLAQAYVYYSQASALQPRNNSYRKRASALMLRGASQIKKESTPAAAVPVPSADPDEGFFAGTPPADLFDSITARELAMERPLAAPPKLDATQGKFDFDLTDTPRGLFEKVGARFGLQLIFDSDYPQGGQRVTFHLPQLDYRSALEILQAATDSFVVPISSRAIMVAHDTPQKRNDLEQYITLSIPVPTVITAQELTEIVQVVRQVSSADMKIGWDNEDSMIVLRDRASRAALAQALLGQLIAYHPQVMVDVELLQVADTVIRNYGFTVTNNFPLAYLGSIQHSMANIPSGVTNLLTFGAGHSLIGIGAAEVQALFNETSSNSRSLYSARMRAGSGQADTFHVGEKYPIITSAFVGASSTNTGGSTTPNVVAPPAISFENLGLEIKATPHVHGADAVSMTIDATYETLNGQSADGIPVIASNKISTEIRLKNDEWAVVAGLIGSTDSKSKSGFWGLDNIPLLGSLFKQISTDKESTNLLIGIRPHILYMAPSENVTQELRAGTDARPYLPL